MSRPGRRIQSYILLSDDDDIQTDNPGLESDSGRHDFDYNSPEIADVLEGPNSSISGPSLPLFPAILTESQMVTNRALIAERSIMITELKQRYEKQTDIALALQKELSEAERLLFEDKARMSTLNRVPAEVLGVIFAFHVHENFESPWLLMQVSRAWRATTLMTRSLWRGIILAPVDWTWRSKGRSFQMNPRSRVRNGMEVCTSESQLINALKRAGSCPLDIEITVPNGSPPPAPYHDESDLVTLVDALFRHRKKPRLRSLIISTSWRFRFPKDSFGEFCYANTVAVTIDAEYPKVIEKLGKEAVHLVKLHAPSTCLKGAESWKSWARVEDLGVIHGRSDLDFDITSTFTAATGVTHLHFFGSPLNPPTRNEDVLKLSSPTHLYLDNSTSLFGIKCPSLTHLHIVNLQGERTALPHDVLSLPNLVELTCFVQSGCVGLLANIRAPSLHKLLLEGAYNKAPNARGFKQLWPPQSNLAFECGLEPVVLHFDNVCLNAKLLGPLIAGRKNLEEFHFGGADITAEFFQSLLPVRGAKIGSSKGTGKGSGKKAGTLVINKGWQMSCPELKRLVISCTGMNTPSATKPLLQGAKQLVEQRLKAGAPFSRFAIKFFGNDGWSELVEPGIVA